MQTLDQSRIEAFAGQIATEVGAALNAALVAVGDQLGLYRAMTDAQPITAGQLAARTSTHERYVREWLNAQAAGGFVTYDSGEDSYTLPAVLDGGAAQAAGVRARVCRRRVNVPAVSSRLRSPR